jgi:hypothetical protein
MRNSPTGVWIIALSGLAIACSGRAAETPRLGRVSANAPVGPDSVVRSGVVFTADVRIEGPADEPRFVARVRLRNVTDSTVVLDSEQDNCEPALQFAAVPGGRLFEWSHVALQASRAERRGEVICVGTGLLVTLAPRGQGELGRQAYPVRALRGDSIPPGQYAVRVPAIVLTWPGGVVRADTVHVWARPVVLA